MLYAFAELLARMLLSDQGGNAIVEYAMIAAGIALPLLAIGFAIAHSGGAGVHTMTSNLSNLGVSPP